MPAATVRDVQFVPGRNRVRLQGVAPRAGSTIEVINLTTIPCKRLHSDDAYELGRADTNGKFSGNVQVHAGDYVRIRARGADSSWLTVRVTGLGQDTRNAEVALFRLGLTANNGQVELTNINVSRPISEPHAKLAFVNQRTGKQSLVELDDLGYFKGTPKIPGQAGDSFSVRVTDGVNDTALNTEVGRVTVPGRTGGNSTFDLPDPAMHEDECRADGTPRFGKVRYSGKLWGAGGPKPEHVKQGQIGDCYLPSAVASVAFAAPEIIKKMVRDEGGGKFVVTFHESAYRGGGKKEIEVDADLWQRSWGGPVYGSCLNSREENEMFLWWPLIEKAYAVWKGDYDAIGDGGSSSAVMQAMTGRKGMSEFVRESRATHLWDLVKEKVDARLPVSFGTYHNSERYSGVGIYSNHSYSCLGYKEENGQRLVGLRNPWGESEPYPGDGKNDGIFWLPIEQVCKHYNNFYSVV